MARLRRDTARRAVLEALDALPPDATVQVSTPGPPPPGCDLAVTVTVRATPRAASLDTDPPPLDLGAPEAQDIEADAGDDADPGDQGNADIPGQQETDVVD